MSDFYLRLDWYNWTTRGIPLSPDNLLIRRLGQVHYMRINTDQNTPNVQQYYLNVGPASATLAQHLTNIGSAFGVSYRATAWMTSQWKQWRHNLSIYHSYYTWCTLLHAVMAIWRHTSAYGDVKPRLSRETLWYAHQPSGR